MAPLPAPFLNVQAESETEKPRSANRPRIGLHHEFLVEHVLQIEKHVEVLAQLAGHREIHRAEAAKTPGQGIHIIIVLRAGVMVLHRNIGKFRVRVLYSEGATMPRHLRQELSDQCGILFEGLHAAVIVEVGTGHSPIGEQPVLHIALNT